MNRIHAAGWLVSLVLCLTLHASASVLPEGLRVIGEEAFSGTGITQVSLTGAEEIHARAFMDCTSLTELELPRSLRAIADDAFLNCQNLTVHVWRESWAEAWCTGREQITVCTRELLECSAAPEAAFPGTEVTLTCRSCEPPEGAASYQWEKSTDGGAAFVPLSLEGAQQSTVTFEAGEDDPGALFRCVMMDDTGVYHSLPLQLMTASRLSITSAAVSGTSVSLTWDGNDGQPCFLQMAKGDGDFETITGELSDTFYDVGGLESASAYRFRVCCASGSGFLYSSPVSVTTQDVSGTVCRALLIGEVDFIPVCLRNWGDVTNMHNMLASVHGTDGADYAVVRRKNVPTHTLLEETIRDVFSGADEDDVSLFFIATHGDTGQENELAGALFLVDDSGEEDYITLEELASCLSTVPGRIVVILESCGSGAAIYDGSRGRGDSDPFGTAAIQAFSAADRALGTGSDTPYVRNAGDFRRNKFYVLTAAAYRQASWGTEATPAHNVFTQVLTRGIGFSGSMPADADADGSVTLQELYAYIREHTDEKEFWDDTVQDYVHQNVQVYPESSSFELFRR